MRHHILPYITIYCHILPYITICDHILPYMTIYIAMHYHKLLYIAIYYHILTYIAINYDIWPYFAIYYQTSRNITRYYYIIPVCHRGLWRLACCTQYRLCGVCWMANPAHTRALPGRARKTLKSTDCEELRGKFF